MPARGRFVAPIPRGEPAVSRSEGPCGPSQRDVGSASRGRRLLPPRDADPPRLFLAAVEALAEADGRSGVPAGLEYGGATT